MENGLLYILAFSAVAIALFACVLPGASDLELPYEQASVTIYKNGSTIIAENATGKEMFRSTNASYIINSAINAMLDLPGYYGKIFIAKGIYELSNTIRFTVPVLFRGEGIDSTILRLDSNVDCNITETAFTSTGYWLTIEDMTLDGGTSNENTIGIYYASNAKDTLIRNVMVYNTTLYNIYITAPWNNKIESVVIEGSNSSIGLYAGIGSDLKISNSKFLYLKNAFDIRTSHSSMIGSFIYENIQHGGVMNWGDGFNLIGNVFQGNSFNNAGVYSSLVIERQVTNIKIQGNTFDGLIGSTNYPFQHIAIMTDQGTTPKGIVIEGNSFNHTATQIIGIQAAVTDKIVKNNLGYVTEKVFSGTNTTATTAVLNHGLTAAATGVWVSFSDSAITGYTWSSTATQVTITPSGTLPASWTVYVRAEYTP